MLVQAMIPLLPVTGGASWLPACSMEVFCESAGNWVGMVKHGAWNKTLNSLKKMAYMKEDSNYPNDERMNFESEFWKKSVQMVTVGEDRSYKWAA